MAEFTINYPTEFREKCFNNLRFAMDVRLIIAAMDHQRHDVVRYYLEDLLDDNDLYISNAISDDGARRVANAKINAHKVRKELYNEYMELLTNALDLKDERTKARLLSKRGSF